MYKKIISVAILILSCVSVHCQDSLEVVFWNLENYYDWTDSGENLGEKEFSSTGGRRWTRKRFYQKTDAIAKTLLAAGGQTAPDIVGFAECENAFAVRQIFSSTLLDKLDYRVVHHDSHDPRGIDCALAYRQESLRLVSSKAVAVDSLLTRDLLLCQFIQNSGDSIAVIVVHHPSKYGGKSDWGRRKAVAKTMFLCDSLSSEGWNRQLVMGDFNDVPSSPLYAEMEERLTSLSKALEKQEKGSIRYQGEWELIDQAWVRGIPDAKADIVSLPFLLEEDRKYGGVKPHRTYLGPRYQGGVSDHLPIIVTIY